MAADLVRLVQVAEMLPQFAAQSTAMVCRRPAGAPPRQADRGGRRDPRRRRHRPASGGRHHRPAAGPGRREPRRQRVGRLDTVVNNAGIMHIGPVADAQPDDWDQMLQINVQGLLYVTRAALPHLLQAAQDSPRRVADLVNISSTACGVARPGTAVYNLAKFGVNGFTEALRQEVMQSRVRVSVVGRHGGHRLSSHLRDGVRQAVEAQVKDMEMLRPEDIADAVTYIVTRNRRVAVNEILVRACDQTW